MSIGSEERERERKVLDDWMRLVGEHRGIINMVSSAGDRTSVSADSPGDS